ncbi:MULTISPECIES: response regulator transcription factor [unclassified Marinobacterium]|jgi:DNA-binding response OmpR family regulator|uniref:response regulator transcription factor n=1 Tax=unclassified Marinobacterium TaxID=2644139 RepID=UPI00156969B4|nr:MULTISPECIES: response regulator transcription factor [unclassified Marinobacterium]NRP15077.1 Transcriptional regulatory protein BaeR [Marinobacterium sp. xm-a-152]NRP35824.1 Transcriptional regulatory protein BaeR [Marinobacterium sp. xm-d-579]NRQ01338.1 Transcriptional regulatory protein BaeR [Marinobacterium sp. xm-d-530]
MPVIALVDDDHEIRSLLSDYLEKNSFTVLAFESAEALLEGDYSAAELLILDVGLPGMDGLALCRTLRQDSNLPIIMLTAASDDVDRILGLELGADDYMGKPFNPRELLARIKALLRRSAPVESPTASSNLLLDRAKRTVSVNGEALSLTGAEFDLLALLHGHDGVISRDQLSMELKGHAALPQDRSIDTLVSRLRTKLTPFSEDETIKSIRGKGYHLVLK